ncbi:L-aspartate oxidase [Alsobacter sp. SYSU M60028]|uniref:L-aspartate oxidase n=1 Tax=Alsobacter ponti TaxID=2962936 RepID=A0ABT1LA15_9HYPH|nr:L-aspartate oxidase [Alsobacter ponti]MCP8938339.1 L-aspartate oxidase [Alsobacter ponti]
MRSPVIIVGGGLAGLFCALKLAPTQVTVLAAAPIGHGASSAWAQGGIAAAMGEGDSPEQHAADTVAAGAGLVDEAVVLGMARDAADRVHDLLDLGVPFDRTLEGKLIQSREAAHSARRIVRVRGDMAGKAIMQALVAAVRRTPSITVCEGEVAEALIVREGRVAGVVARGQAGRAKETRAFLAGAVVLATGGVGHLYAVTTNPPQANGNGLAIAAEAGALVADAEFVQFHPTAIDIGRDPAPLATEALRGEGATLVNRAGERFMAALHPDAELAPRDIVARGVFAEIQAGRGAFLDCRAAIGAEFPERFPTVAAACRGAGIDPVTDLIPVAPAEHYHMGGIWTDERGATSLPGLWAIGEVASTGVHGANRLASNSLLEAVVFADRVAADLRALAPVAPSAEFAPPPAGFEPHPDADGEAIAALRRLMSDKVGVVRDAAGLAEALAGIVALERAALTPALRNMARSALLIAASAYARRESRGGHMRADHPAPDPALARRSRLTLGEARWLAEGALAGRPLSPGPST